jgi:ElaB/YqjD/DUF883 family membrane-anchored ribosome-binding protein
VKDSVSEAASSVAGRAGELKNKAGERIGELGSEARRQTRRIRTNLEHAAEENPLALAIGAAVVGLALGMLLPGTRREDELMGSTRDQLVDGAERVKDAAVEAGRELKETIRTEIEEHKPEVKQVVQEAGHTLKEQVKESARRVKKEAKDAAK